jgi:nitrogen fixation NifU-like protein
MEFDTLQGLYKEKVLEHCRKPHNRKRLESPGLHAKAVNPFCGDEIEIEMRLEGDTIVEIGLVGEGCAINQATGSLLSDALLGKSVQDAGRLAEAFRDLMAGEMLSEEQELLIGDMTLLNNVRDFPVRIKCTLLSISALEDALSAYRKTGKTA